MKATYLLINIASVIIPFVFSFHPKIRFDKQGRPLIKAMILVLLVFLPWDILFTDLGVWGFNSNYVLGIQLNNLPIEEVLFFICIPYSCVFTYYCLNKFLNTKRFSSIEHQISLAIIFFLLITAILNYNKLYTSVTFFALAIFITVLKYILKVQWLHKFYFSYLFLLIPFFIVNGLLTGTGPDEPIVWYNNQENIGIRMLTIPFEDIFYGMLLLMLTVGLYEYFMAKKNSLSEASKISKINP